MGIQKHARPYVSDVLLFASWSAGCATASFDFVFWSHGVLTSQMDYSFRNWEPPDVETLEEVLKVGPSP